MIHQVEPEPWDESSFESDAREVEVIASYESVELRRIDGGCLGKGTGYYEVEDTGCLRLQTRDPFRAWSSFVAALLSEFCELSFNSLLVFPDQEVPRDLREKGAPTGKLTLPAGNLGVELLEKLNRLLTKYHQKTDR